MGGSKSYSHPPAPPRGRAAKAQLRRFFALAAFRWVRDDPAEAGRRAATRGRHGPGSLGWVERLDRVKRGEDGCSSVLAWIFAFGVLFFEVRC